MDRPDRQADRNRLAYQAKINTLADRFIAGEDYTAIADSLPEPDRADVRVAEGVAVKRLREALELFVGNTVDIETAREAARRVLD